jgi:tryptophan synthase alpha chain
MNRISEKFESLRRENKKAFIPYLTVGFPNPKLDYEIILRLIKSGADIIELGVPFSDPLADGPTIQSSSQIALKNGINLSKVFNLAERIRSISSIPLVIMSYYNPIYQYGIKNFVRDLTKSQIDGMIIPDLPPEEYRELKTFADKEEIATIFLVAPNSTLKRIRLIARESSGFIYFVSVTGTTGARETLNKEIISLIRQLRLITNKPVCVGFGISNQRQVRELSKIADGVIVGSYLINIILKEAENPDLLEILERDIKKLALGTRINL